MKTSPKEAEINNNLILVSPEETHPKCYACLWLIQSCLCYVFEQIKVTPLTLTSELPILPHCEKLGETKFLYDILYFIEYRVLCVFISSCLMGEHNVC